MGLHVESHGSGPDLVLLHGWGMNASLWDDVAAVLAQRFRVHSADLPGHGGSSTCTPYELDVVTAVLAAALPPHAVVCGWSLGGQVAMNWALTRPGEVKRLVLIASTPRFVKGPDWDSGVDGAVIDDYALGLAQDWRVALRRFNELQAHGDGQRRAVSRRLNERMLAYGEPIPAALAGGLHVLRGTDLRSSLARITQPVLILHGACDAVVPLAAGEYLQRALPCANLDVFADTGHAPLIAQPRRTALRIMEFCRGT